jgi:hypothetical protein
MVWYFVKHRDKFMADGNFASSLTVREEQRLWEQSVEENIGNYEKSARYLQELNITRNFTIS